MLECPSISRTSSRLHTRPHHPETRDAAHVCRRSCQRMARVMPDALSHAHHPLGTLGDRAPPRGDAHTSSSADASICSVTARSARPNNGTKRGLNACRPPVPIRTSTCGSSPSTTSRRRKCHCSPCASPVPIANATRRCARGSVMFRSKATCSSSVSTVHASSLRAPRARGIRRRRNGLWYVLRASHASVNDARSRFSALRHVFAASARPRWVETKSSCNHSRASASVTSDRGIDAMSWSATCVFHRRRSSRTLRYPSDARSFNHSTPHSPTVSPGHDLVEGPSAMLFVFSFTILNLSWTWPR